MEVIRINIDDAEDLEALCRALWEARATIALKDGEYHSHYMSDGYADVLIINYKVKP